MRLLNQKLYIRSAKTNLKYPHLPPLIIAFKGQLISKANCQAMNSSKNRRNEFIFTSMLCVFVSFLEEIEDAEKVFRNHLTFN